MRETSPHIRVVISNLKSTQGQRRWSTFLMRCLLVFFGLTILAAILLPNFVRCGHHQGPLTACKSNLKYIGTALEMYSTDYNGSYPRNLETLVPNYIEIMPKCPNSSYQTSRASFGRKAPGNDGGEFQNYYYFTCTGRQHAEYGIPPDYPRYDAIRGLMERP